MMLPVLTGDRPTLAEFDAQGSRPSDPLLNPMRVDSDDIRRWVEARDPRPIRRWDELGREEYARSFAVAQTAGADIIDDLYFAFYDTVAAGGTERDFEAMVLPIMRQKGWLADKSESQIATRLRLIYDTNLRLARASGQWSRYWNTRSALPYLRGITGRDDRVRHPPKSPSDHTAWEGILLPIDHPFWTRWFPPLGFRCRCDVIQMTRSQLARFRGGVTSEAELARREARLGTPIFLPPAASVPNQIAAMVEDANAEAMPGRPNVVPALVMNRGSRLWEAVLLDEVMKGLDDVLARIFGKAA